MIKTALAKALTVKVAAAALATTAAAGGVAYAASEGALPGQSGDHSVSRSAAPEKSKDATAKDNNGKGPGEANGSPSPSLVGLCHAYTSGVATSKGKALENPAFTVLITTAGGADKVAAYCTKLLADEAAAKPSHPATGKPADAGKPTDKPAEGGKPTASPRPTR